MSTIRRIVSSFLAVAALAFTIGGIGSERAAAAAPLRVLVLGDSYSAGNGTEVYGGFGPCHRSTEVWGALAARRLGVRDGRAVEVVNRACSDGRAVHVTSPRLFRDDGFTTGGWSADTDAAATQEARRVCAARPTESPDEYWTGAATRLGNGRYQAVCRRWLRPQVAAVDTTFDVVFLTLGGNDVEFSTVVEECLVLARRRAAECATALNSAENKSIAYGGRKLKAALRPALDAITARLNPPSRAGNAGQVVLLSYPYLISNDSYAFDGVDVGRRLRRLSDAGDDVGRSLMARYDDRSTTTSCRPLRSLFGERTKHHFGLHSPSAPINVNGSDEWWLWEVIPLGIFETMHPKPAGQQAMSRAAVDALDGAVACPQSLRRTLRLHPAGLTATESQLLPAIAGRPAIMTSGGVVVASAIVGPGGELEVPAAAGGTHVVVTVRASVGNLPCVRSGVFEVSTSAFTAVPGGFPVDVPLPFDSTCN